MPKLARLADRDGRMRAAVSGLPSHEPGLALLAGPDPDVVARYLAARRHGEARQSLEPEPTAGLRRAIADLDPGWRSEARFPDAVRPEAAGLARADLSDTGMPLPNQNGGLAVPGGVRTPEPFDVSAGTTDSGRLVVNIRGRRNNAERGAAAEPVTPDGRAAAVDPSPDPSRADPYGAMSEGLRRLPQGTFEHQPRDWSGETAVDWLASAGTGIARGVVGIPGLLGDGVEAIDDGIQWLAAIRGRIAGLSREELDARRERSRQVAREWQRRNLGFAIPEARDLLPTSRGIQTWWGNNVWPWYEPRTIAGQGAQAMGEIVGGIGGPIVAGRVARRLVPGGPSRTRPDASEAPGQSQPRAAAGEVGDGGAARMGPDRAPPAPPIPGSPPPAAQARPNTAEAVRESLPAPALVGRVDPAEIVLRARRNDVLGPRSQRFQPSGEYDLFLPSAGPPLVQIPHLGPRGPRPPLPAGAMPTQGHWAALAQQQDAVADWTARLVIAHGGPIRTSNYNLDPIVHAAVRAGVPAERALASRDELAAAIAAASIARTADDNMRIAAWLHYRRAQGLPLRTEYPTGINGMRLHADLYSDLRSGADLSLRAPKPSGFHRTLQGDDTAGFIDRNDRRLQTRGLAEVNNGRLERNAFVNQEAYEQFQRTGVIRPGDLNINAPTRTIDGVRYPVGYLIEEETARIAARRLGLTPAQLHDNLRQLVPSHLSGLRSHGTLLNRFEDRVEGAARALDISKPEALGLFVTGQIPLRALIGAGGAGAAYAVMSPGQAEAAPQGQAPDGSAARTDRESLVDRLTARLLAERGRRGPR